MIEWLDKHLVEGWRSAGRMASIRLAAAVSALVTLLSSNPDLLLGIISFMPANPIERAVMAVGVGLIAFFGPSALRLWRQNDATDKPEA
jgi:hypothetical protein